MPPPFIFINIPIKPFKTHALSHQLRDFSHTWGSFGLKLSTLFILFSVSLLSLADELFPVINPKYESAY